jgi:hypothetical protein
MRTDGNPKLIEFRNGLEVLPYRRPWPAAYRLAGYFVLSGVIWAVVLALILMLGALAHGY